MKTLQHYPDISVYTEGYVEMFVLRELSQSQWLTESWSNIGVRGTV